MNGGMALSNVERQQRYRAKLAQRLGQMELALTRIAARLDGNDKPLAVELRAIAEEGLR